MKAPPASIVWDLLGFAGCALVVAGLWLIYPPVALIAGGLTLAAIGVVGAKRWVS